MLRQIKLLTALGLCNLCGFNEARYSKDPAKRKRLLGMGFVYLFVLLVFWGYLALLSAGLLYLGVGEVIPCYLYLIACMVIFCFSFFKAADVIFQKGTYELLISLPVSQSSIVISRFLTMYITNLLLSFAVVLPGSIMYGVFLHSSPGFYIRMLLGTLFLPAIPLVTATALSSVIFAVSAGMRHKNLVSIAMTLGLVLAAIVFCFGTGETAAVIETFELSAFRSLTVLMTEQIKKIYTPAGWFGSAVTEGSLPQGILLAGVSVLMTALLVWVLQKYFVKISSAVNATVAGKRYKMENLSVSTVGKALWRRELKRYFASSVYVVNTIIGNILMTVFAVMLLVVGTEKITGLLELPMENDILPVIPFVLAMIGNMMPMTACSVSMEGKQWWLYQTLPITKKQIFDAKLLAGLTVAAPFYLVTEAAAFLALKPSVKEGILLVCIPLLYTVFLSIAGLSVNLKFPVFQWKSEVQVVKQSASVLAAMLTDLAFTLIPAALLLMFPEQQELLNVSAAVVVLAASVILYRKVLCGTQNELIG